MELLSPAGSFSTLKAAIEGGANAVYMGGKSYGARHFAQNFSDAELEEAIDYAHRHDVKVYITVNTLVKDSEMGDAVSFVQYLSDIHADAVILQDLGLLQALKDVKIDKHASTQMGIHSREGVLWAAKNGIKRVILARELTLEEITNIAYDSPVELEIFVHGALCYCISGQCLFSSVVGARSGNRGACAQPCRKSYKMGDKEGYLLSTKDLNCLDLLPALHKAGIKSIKLEGRMRGEAYAYMSALCYSKALRMIESRNSNDIISAEDLLDLETVFNRGMGHGYLDGLEKVVNPLFADNRGKYLGQHAVENNVLLVPSNDILVGDGLALYSGTTKIGGLRVEDRLRPRLTFPVKDDVYDVYRNSSARILSLQNVDKSERHLEKIKDRKSATLKLPQVKRSHARGELSFYVSSLKCLQAVLPFATRIYYEYNRSLDEALSLCQEANIEIVAILPRFSPYAEEETSIPMMVNSVDQMQRFYGKRLFGSYHLNLFNSHFVSDLYQTTISPELSRDEISLLSRQYPGRLEQMVFGRLELMVTRDPEMDDGTLVDEKKYKFPVYRDRFGLSHILNSADLMLLEHLDDLDRMGIESYGIDLRRRPTALAALVAKSFAERDFDKRREIKNACGQVTYGHYLRGV